MLDDLRPDVGLLFPPAVGPFLVAGQGQTAVEAVLVGEVELAGDVGVLLLELRDRVEMEAALVGVRGPERLLEPADDDGAGFVCLLSADRSGVLGTGDCDVRFDGAPGEMAGFSVAGAGDMDGDGHDDFLIGFSVGPSADYLGAAYLYLGW